MDIIPILAIVQTHGDTYGVVIGVTGMAGNEEYRVQLIEETRCDIANERLFAASYVGLYNRDQINRIGFCENDFLPMALLCAASGDGAHGDGWRTNC